MIRPVKPTLIVSEEKIKNNIREILDKISRSDGEIRFRPHFKTHQSAQVGRWFRELGVTACTVSSVDMARYFAQDGWKDITIAILVNRLEINVIRELAGATDLGLLVDSVETAALLDESLDDDVNVWIKIDTGYHRTGLENGDKADILSVAKSISSSKKLHLKGLLTHSGHSYAAKSTDEIINVYKDTVTRLNSIKDFLAAQGITGVEISIGDTPTCSVVEKYEGVDEIRCGNFVFYDVMQLALGACKEENISAALACPVIAKYPQRNEIVIFGGAVHLSKDNIPGPSGEKIYGYVVLPDFPNKSWGPVEKDTYVSSVSQEHGIIKTNSEFIDRVEVGDILMVLPVHSCLTANLMRQYLTMGGEIISTLNREPVVYEAG